jgi:hypothetical protein
MAVPLSYVVRNLAARKVTTALTAGGLALVVYVFATVLMLDEGLRQTLVDTGSWDSVLVIRRAADTEVKAGGPGTGRGGAPARSWLGERGTVRVEGDRGPDIAQQGAKLEQAVERRHSRRRTRRIFPAAAG